MRAAMSSFAVLLCGLSVAGCGDDLLEPPLVVEARGLRVTLWSAPARVEVVRLADGEVVFDGLPGGAGGAADEPTSPHAAAAFRAAPRTSIETQVGSFKIEDDRVTPWEGVQTLRDVRATGRGRATATLAGRDGVALGQLTVSIAPPPDGAPADGAHLALTVTGAPEFQRASLAFACAPDEHFLGLGGQSFDVDHRGQTVPLWVEEDGISKRPDDSYEGVWFLTGRRHSTHTPMPIYLSSRGWAVAVDTDARAVFALCSEADDVIRLETWEPSVALQLFVPAPDADRHEPLRDALSMLTAWTGRPAPLPAFAWAPWIDAIYGQEEVRAVAARLRAEDVAVGVLWSEDWRGANDEGTGYVLEEDWRVDRDLYPDFELLADELHADGYEWLTYHNTFVDSEADVFDEVLAEGYSIHDAEGEPYLFTGVKFRDATMLDLSNPAAREWAAAVYREGLALGADGWMADFAEWLPHDAVLASGEDPLQAHNRYPVEWARLNHELFAAQAAEDGDADRLYFMRSAWLGSQPLVSVVWAGDQQTDFSEGDGLRSVIPMGLGLGVTGFPYYGHDIAGYMSQLTVPTTKELWFRWCSLGALSPIMRTHHGRAARENWSWQSDAETIAHLRRWSRVHVQLADYLRDAAVDGLPIMRPVALHYPDEPWAWTTTDQFLLGDRLLVAPVVEEGATTRTLRLPPGRWYPLVGGPSVEGGGELTVDAPLTELPALLPEGAALPLLPADLDTLTEGAAAPGTVTRANTTSPREVLLTPGAPVRPGIAGAWTPRARALPAPTAATADGAPLPLAVVDGEVVAEVACATATAPVVVEFAGGGRYEVAPCPADGAGRLRLRLRAP